MDLCLFEMNAGGPHWLGTGAEARWRRRGARGKLKGDEREARGSRSVFRDKVEFPIQRPSPHIHAEKAVLLRIAVREHRIQT
jgi:hypothetical protein